MDFFDHSNIPENMLNRGQLVLNNFLKPLKILFEQKNVPKEPWSDEQIEFLLQTLSNMDTDKDDQAARVGEREARIASKLHLNTSAGFCHGVGRSGFLTAPQPKAPGGSIMYELSNYLARNILRNFGLPNIEKAIVLPLCTGMSLALCLGALKPDLASNKRTVLVPQIDHRSILKAFDLLGLSPKIINGKVFGDAVRVPFQDIKNALGLILSNNALVEDSSGNRLIYAYETSRESISLSKIKKEKPKLYEKIKDSGYVTESKSRTLKF